MITPFESKKKSRGGNRKALNNYYGPTLPLPIHFRAQQSREERGGVHRHTSPQMMQLYLQNNGKTSTWKMIPPSVLLLLLLDHPLTSTSISTWGNCIGIFHTPASCVSSMLWVGGWYVMLFGNRYISIVWRFLGHRFSSYSWQLELVNGRHFLCEMGLLAASWKLVACLHASSLACYHE